MAGQNYDWMDDTEHQPLVDAITDGAQTARERPGDFMTDQPMNADDEPDKGVERSEQRMDNTATDDLTVQGGE